MSRIFGNGIPRNVHLVEAQSLYQASRRLIQTPSIHSTDPMERTASEAQSVAFSIFEQFSELRAFRASRT